MQPKQVLVKTINTSKIEVNRNTQKDQNRKKIIWESKGSQLGNLHILLGIHQTALGPGQSTARVTYLSVRIHPKSICIFLLKVAVTLLSGSRKGTGSVSRLHANTSSPDVYWRKRLNRLAHLQLCHRNPDMLKRVLNQIASFNSTAGKCAPMQITNQLEHDIYQKWSSFQMNYD